MTDHEWSFTVSDDPHRLVALSRVSSLINEFFHLDDDNHIDYRTPFIWWNRSKQNRMAFNMFVPVGYGGKAGDGDTRPFWHQEQIIHWYARWKGLDVGESQQAGDRTTNRGQTIPSVWRTA